MGNCCFGSGCTIPCCCLPYAMELKYDNIGCIEEQGCCCFRRHLKGGTEYSKIKNKIKPLDIMFFRGNGIFSDSISFAENAIINDGKWSHAGLVITNDIIPIENGEDGKLYLWESTTIDGGEPEDVERKVGVNGVQIRDLEQVINDYNDDIHTVIGWSKLPNNPLDEKERKDVINKLRQFHLETKGMLYNNIPTGLCTALFSCCGKVNDAQNSLCCDSCNSNNRLFCSQLVAEIYRLLNIIDKKIDPRTFAPVELLDYVNEPIIIAKP